jgi:cellulose synthase/poly-beta-1,6-N-acetylglucosamine synthase-like glycosyltransferase
MSIEVALYWLSVAWIAYVWAGYPLALAALSMVRRFRPASSDQYLPTVSVLIAARNEHKDIGWKLRQTLAWDYPQHKLEVLVGSDASTDGTDDEIRAVGDSRLIFVRNPERVGKNITLNRLARLASGNLLFFTDANTQISPACIKKMVRHFTDPRVGCVTGTESNVDGPAASAMTAGSNAYLGYESLVNSLESRFGSVLVCDGSIYCLRRSLFNNLDPELANDLEHPIRAASADYAVLFEPEARSFEHCSSSPREEFGRRRRIAAQGALGMWRLKSELRGVRWWQFISRKFMRWLTIVPFVVALIAGLRLWHDHLYLGLVAAQAGFCAVAATGVWLRGNSKTHAALRLPFVFLLAHIAVFVGVIDACRRKTFATWNIAELSRGANPGVGPLNQISG